MKTKKQTKHDERLELLLRTVHFNACEATMLVCAKEWGMIKGGKWSKKYEHLKLPPHPEINTIRNQKWFNKLILTFLTDKIK